MPLHPSLDPLLLHAEHAALNQIGAELGVDLLSIEREVQQRVQMEQFVAMLQEVRDAQRRTEQHLHRLTTIIAGESE